MLATLIVLTATGVVTCGAVAAVGELASFVTQWVTPLGAVLTATLYLQNSTLLLTRFTAFKPEKYNTESYYSRPSI